MKKLFITGGTGFLSKYILDNIPRYIDDSYEITVYSRDEAKQYKMKKKYPKIKYVIGDIRNYELMKRCSEGCHYGIFAASMKQIDACTENTEEALDVIVHGGFNSKRIAIENNFLSSVFISTDKSRAPTTIYGAMKYLAGENFILPNRFNSNNTQRRNTILYGNVLNSTGSVIPLIWDYINKNETLTLFHPDMTRFIINADEASNLVLNILITKNNINNCTIFPALKSFKILDLYEIYSEKFGLKFKIDYQLRPNEKLHEIMVANEEIRKCSIVEDKIIAINERPINNAEYIQQYGDKEYSSKDYIITKKELEYELKQYEYFNPGA